MNRLIECRRYKGIDTVFGNNGFVMLGRCSSECDGCPVRFNCFTTAHGEMLSLSVCDFAKVRERRGFKQLVPPQIDL